MKIWNQIIKAKMFWRQAQMTRVIRSSQSEAEQIELVKFKVDFLGFADFHQLVLLHLKAHKIPLAV